MVETIGNTTEGSMIINVGPQHPATHGVLHLVITLNGETIQKVEPHLGYIHRSIEVYLCYQQNGLFICAH
jgi:NADH-quinone oxidoreductase subunit D/NADH-quinone oxidoreductase subunit C/D